MSKIDGLNNIIQVLRRRISERQQTSNVSKKDALDAYSQSDAVSPQRIPVEQLQEKIKRDLSDLDPNDSEWDQKASRSFIESVMAWEFGEEFLQDSGTTDMLDEISNTMINNQEVSGQFKSMLRNLLA